MASIALVFVAVFGLLSLAAFAWWLLMLIDAVRTPASAWDAAGQSQLVHILLMVFLGVIGTIVYVVVARPRLRAVTA